MEVLRLAYDILDERGRKQFLWLPLMATVSSLLQAVGVASVPLFFMLVLSGPANTSINLPFEPPSDMGKTGLMVLGLLAAGTVTSAFSAYYGIMVSLSQYPRLASRLLDRYLKRDFEWHIQRNSSELENKVLTEVLTVINSVLQQCVMMTVRGGEIVLISATLLVANAKVAVAAGLSFLLVYGLLYVAGRNLVRKKGRARLEANAARYQAAGEALSGIKTIKTFRCAASFVSRFRQSAADFSSSTLSIEYFSLLPKFLVEFLVFGGVILSIVMMHSRGWGSTDMIPLLALYGAAAVRLLPALQQSYFSATLIRAATPSLRAVAEDLLDNEPPSKLSSLRGVVTRDHLVEFQGVSYRYPGVDEEAIRNLSFTIGRGEKIGIVGLTGAGKTTLVDLLLGLLPPTRGQVLTCETEQLVGYVPQEISFIDDTVAANIALGQNDVAQERLVRACQKACIADFIRSLPQAYQTRIGQDGVRFSGGQRQRLGIARALYLEPEVLLLDEASSALDSRTEGEIFEQLFADPDLTVVAIAHRLSVLKQCDRIFLLENGQLKAEGSYHHLCTISPLFASLASEEPKKAIAI